jgi:hypothetical protein
MWLLIECIHFFNHMACAKKWSFTYASSAKLIGPLFKKIERQLSSKLACNASSSFAIMASRVHGKNLMAKLVLS